MVYTEHLPWSGYVGPTRWLNRLTFALNDATILVSDGVWDGLPPRARGRTRVIVHGVPLERIGGSAPTAMRCAGNWASDPTRS